MQTKTVDVTTLSDTELKALAYDNLQQRDSINSSLQIIQNEMDARVLKAQEEADTAKQTATETKAKKAK